MLMWEAPEPVSSTLDKPVPWDRTLAEYRAMFSARRTAKPPGVLSSAQRHTHFLDPSAVMGVPVHTPLLNATDPLAASVAWNGRVSCRGTGSFPEGTGGRARLLHS